MQFSQSQTASGSDANILCHILIIHRIFIPHLHTSKCPRKCNFNHDTSFAFTFHIHHMRLAMQNIMHPETRAFINSLSLLLTWQICTYQDENDGESPKKTFNIKIYSTYYAKNVDIFNSHMSILYTENTNGCVFFTIFVWTATFLLCMNGKQFSGL